MSQQVSPSEQGPPQGANSAIASVAAPIGPAIFIGAFSLLLIPLRGAAFDLTALILLAALVVALVGYADASRRPASVSLQTSQSGFSGLLNHGSAQPRSRQRCTTSASICLAVEIEQRQLAARLGEPAPQVEQFRQRRQVASQTSLSFSAQSATACATAHFS